MYRKVSNLSHVGFGAINIIAWLHIWVKCKYTSGYVIGVLV